MRAAVAEIAILAVDGGNSKTDIALVSAGGEVLGAVRGPGASHQSLGVEGALDGLGAMITMACLDAGLDPATRPLSGDWGGGHHIGIAAVGAALRGEDGRGPATALQRLVPGHFGLPTALAVVEALYLGRIDEERVLELPPLVFTAAEAGDPAAAEIVSRQADEVVTMEPAAIRRLGLADRDPDVVLGGGLFQRHDPGFLDRIRAGIAAVAPAAVLRQLTAPPVVGAALLGVDRLGGSAEAPRRLRG